MSLITLTDRIMQRLEAENADRGTYTQLANELETAAVRETDPGRSGKLRSMAGALRKVSQDEEHHLGALTHIYEDLGKLQKQQATARSEAEQLVKGAGQAGRAGARLAGRGISYIGKKLSSLETEGSQLPIVSWQDVEKGLQQPGIVKTSYFLDARLRELRAINNPHNVIKLNDFEVEYFKERAR